MEVKNIILFVLLFIIIIIVISYMRSGLTAVTTGLISAQNMQTIPATSLASNASTTISPSNFTYSIWMFIDDWNYKYGEPKIIFGRMATGSGADEPCPTVVLGNIQNNISISLAVYPEETTTPPVTYIVHHCDIENIPIQKWVNLLISAYGRTLDTYIDGKLVKTCVLPGVPKIDATAPVYVTPMGGFSGWTSKFQYWPVSTDPQQAWNIYTQGYGGNSLGNILGNYSVKMSVNKGDTEQSSISF